MAQMDSDTMYQLMSELKSTLNSVLTTVEAIHDSAEATVYELRQEVDEFKGAVCQESEQCRMATRHWVTIVMVIFMLSGAFSLIYAYTFGPYFIGVTCCHQVRDGVFCYSTVNDDTCMENSKAFHELVQSIRESEAEEDHSTVKSESAPPPP